MSRRVVVTGMGVVCPTGANIEDFRKNLEAGVCGIRSRTFAPVANVSMTLNVAPVEGFEARAEALGRDMQRTDRFTQFTVAAADEALADSGLVIDEALGARTAAIIGTGIGGAVSQDSAYVAMMMNGKKPHPLTILRIIPNAPASHVSIRYGVRGPAFAVSSACASGAHAIGVAADMIRMGTADAALAGASEAVLSYGPLEAWKAMHIMSDELCRPFSKNRKGLVIGEGAGVFVLEEFEAAKKRGARIYAELAGFGMNADGKDMINPAVEGSSSAMRIAIKDLGGIDPAALYINAHGTGTLMNDPTETKAIRMVFGADADRLIVSSTKSMHGHLLGGAGAIEAAAALIAIKEGFVPPTINLDEPDPACDLDYAPNEARRRRIDVAVSNSFAFGGLNAVLAFRRV
jgi:nodulation protein E